MNSHGATARLAKIMRRNETVQVSNVLRPNGEFTESSVETMNCLLERERERFIYFAIHSLQNITKYKKRKKF